VEGGEDVLQGRGESPSGGGGKDGGEHMNVRERKERSRLVVDGEDGGG